MILTVIRMVVFRIKTYIKVLRISVTKDKKKWKLRFEGLNLLTDIGVRITSDVPLAIYTPPDPTMHLA